MPIHTTQGVPWEYKEVVIALDETKTPAEAAKLLPKRKSLGVQFLRNSAKQFQRGRKTYVTGNLRTHFEQYFQNLGNGNLQKMDATETPVERDSQETRPTETMPVEAQAPIETPVEAPVVEETVKEDICQTEFALLETRAQTQFEDLQTTILAMGSLKAVHETHDQISLIAELTRKANESAKENKQLKEANEVLFHKNQELNEFREKALEENKRKPSFGEKLATKFSFGEQTNENRE